ncbi:ComEC/Rec2 family competence protein [Clostridium felsineum]|uniref:ComEC/Rec2 family competence protein n=1 Tax=Clostridium felsineum TaxID=36839 RepID=UPI00098CC3DB|nr:ComEC/Rec2 family competence protein [Clostridium felsineum]URZ01166.1 hypothetical protein CLAUR_011540 [Clostridium felsineum]
MKKPLVFYFVSIILGILTAALLKNSIVIGAVIAASFFGIIFFTLKKEFAAINFLFFLIGLFCFVYYFNVNVDNKKAIDIRICDKSGIYFIGNYKGRKINIDGKNIKFKFGEKVRLKGDYKKDIDYGNGIIGIIKVKEIEKRKNDLITNMYDIRENIYEKYASKIGKDRAGIIMSLCFGDTSNLSQKDKNELKKLGIIHAVSVSGMHMAVIYEILEKTFGLASAMVVSLIYVIFTGCLPATMRAFFMIFILKISIKVYKNYDSMSSLALSGILLLIFSPYYIFNIGAVLSYLATLGIMLYYRKILRVLYRLPKKLNESISLTLSAQIFSVPYAGFVLKTFSGGFILGNLVIVPIYSVLIILGNLGGIFYKLNVVFEVLCYFINILLKSTDGLTRMVLKITPPIIYLSETQSICLIGIFLSFIMIKKGYRKFMYLPILFGAAIIFNSYNTIFQVECVNVNNKQAYVIRYEGYKAFITNYRVKNDNQKENMLSSLGVNKLVSIKNKYTLNMKNNYTICFDKGVQIYYKRNKIVDIKNDSIYYNKFYSNSYGIIKMESYNKYSFLATKAKVDFINGKVLVSKGCEK